MAVLSNHQADCIFGIRPKLELPISATEDHRETGNRSKTYAWSTKTILPCAVQEIVLDILSSLLFRAQ